MHASPHTLAPEARQWEDLTLPLSEVMRVAQRLLVFAGVAAFFPFGLIWGLPDLPGRGEWPAFFERALVEGAVFVLVYAASAVVHEGLHALAMVVFAGVPLRSIRFGMRLSEGIAYVHTSRPMTVRAYRVVLALPGVLQGLLPLVAGLAVGSGWVTFYGFVMLVSAAGDVAVLRLLRPVAPGRLVLDHPHDVGCRLLAEGRVLPEERVDAP